MCHETSRRVWPIVALILLVGLAGCQRTAPPPATDTDRPTFPAQVYDAAAADGQRVFDLSPEDSRLRIHAYREGPLAQRFGHNHVLQATRWRGAVAWPEGEIGNARMDVLLPVAGMTLDDPAVRESLGGGFASELSEEDVADTRANMESVEVLAVDRFPAITLELQAVRGELPRLILDLAVRIRGQEQVVSVPVAVTVEADQLHAEGRAVLRQTDFGMEPFSAVGGGLRVADALMVEFDIVGEAR